jgi:hypothetical protein
MPRSPDDEYSEQEAQQRFMASLKAAVNTPPKPLKSMTPKSNKAQSEKRANRKNKS